MGPCSLGNSEIYNSPPPSPPPSVLLKETLIIVPFAFISKLQWRCETLHSCIYIERFLLLTIQDVPLGDMEGVLINEVSGLMRCPNNEVS